jgi:electron transport complex protein RnfC
MKINTFKRGVHPWDGKEPAMECSIKKVNPSGEMSYPLNQHIGAPAESIVNLSDRVLKGQMIAKAGGFVSANIFSAVSGTVKAIKPITTLSGPEVNSIIIEDDGQYEIAEGYGKECDYTKLSSKEILDKIQYAGIVGLGGAGFPTHVKLTVKEPSSLNYIIVNGAECEPYLTSDYRMMPMQHFAAGKSLSITFMPFISSFPFSSIIL